MGYYRVEPFYNCHCHCLAFSATAMAPVACNCATVCTCHINNGELLHMLYVLQLRYTQWSLCELRECCEVWVFKIRPRLIREESAWGNGCQQRCHSFGVTLTIDNYYWASCVSPCYRKVHRLRHINMHFREKKRVEHNVKGTHWTLNFQAKTF